MGFFMAGVHKLFVYALPALYLWASEVKNCVYEGGGTTSDILWVCHTG